MRNMEKGPQNDNKESIEIISSFKERSSEDQKYYEETRRNVEYDQSIRKKREEGILLSKEEVARLRELEMNQKKEEVSREEKISEKREPTIHEKWKKHFGAEAEAQEIIDEGENQETNQTTQEDREDKISRIPSETEVRGEEQATGQNQEAKLTEKKKGWFGRVWGWCGRVLGWIGVFITHPLIIITKYLKWIGSELDKISNGGKKEKKK